MTVTSKIKAAHGASKPKLTRCPYWLTLLLVGLMFSSVLPSAASALVHLATGAAAVLVTINALRVPGRARSTVVFAWLIIIYWLILIFHPNIPALEIGLLGFRKTAYCVLGLLIAATLSEKRIASTERTAIVVLVAGMSASVIMFLFAPGIEASLVDRSAADVYTGLYNGQPRLQGIFAGPFHAATGGLILACWGLTRLNVYRLLGPTAIMIGIVAVYLSNVRTAYAALVLAVLAIVLTSASVGRFLKRIAGALLFAVLAIFTIDYIMPEKIAFFTSIVDFMSDSRFLGRLDGFQTGIDLFVTSPLVGWGAGSAGDTLGIYFSGNHVTSHNIFLKIAVEGGLMGLLLWLAFAGSIVRHLPLRERTSSTGFAILAALCGMGLTGSAIEALPLTFYAFFMVGVYLRQPSAGLSKYGSFPRRVRPRV